MPRKAIFQSPEERKEYKKKYLKEWVKRNAQKMRDYHRRYKRAYRIEKGMDKDRARSAVRVAILKGTLVPQPCVVCNEQKTEGHHYDYNEPLDVIWFCRKCHTELHKEDKRAGWATVAPLNVMNNVYKI